MSDQRDGNKNGSNDDGNDSRSPEEIQRGIEATQGKLAQDLDELSYRVSPERVKEQAAERLEGVTGAASDATDEMVREVVYRAEAVGERVARRLRENPLPAVVVGGALVAGWLLLQGTRGNRREMPGSARRGRPERAYTPATVGAARPVSDTPTRDTPSQAATYDFDAESDRYENHYEENFAGTDQNYEHYERAYRFGAALPDYPDYNGDDWEATREDAKRDWERTNDAPWEEVREAVRFGWERSRSRR